MRIALLYLVLLTTEPNSFGFFHKHRPPLVVDTATVNVSWAASNALPNAVYRIQWGLQSKTYIANNLTFSTSYTISGLETNTTYFLAIQGANGSNWGPVSCEVKFVTNSGLTNSCN